MGLPTRSFNDSINLFSLKKISKIPLAERLNHFLMNWQKITADQTALGYVKGYRIPLLKMPFQNYPPPSVKMRGELAVCKR